MIQLHGAIGVTWEHRAHRYLKRALSGRHLFGSLVHTSVRHCGQSHRHTNWRAGRTYHSRCVK